MTLTTMEPNPAWDPDSYPEVVEAFENLGDDATVRVWGADWCGDCRSQLPDFAAALEAADVDDVEQYPVERENREVSETPQVDGEAVDGEKYGPKMNEYGVELIPTIVVERDGEELARFVEEERVEAAVYLAERLD